MEQEISREVVVSYYNEHTQNKLNDYVKVNPRIEEAWKTLVKYSPSKPLQILEVGCGMGGVCRRMNKFWPAAHITGMDISTESIQIANKLFANDKVDFYCGILTPQTFNTQFDLIVFMDVYEHIAVADRPVVHAALKKMLRNKGRIFLSVPTPHNLKWCLKYKPETMQPVDEFISLGVINKLAEDTGTEVQFYETKNVWNVGDYAHVVLEKNDDFEAAFFHPKPVTLTEKIGRAFNKIVYRLGSIRRKAYADSKLK